MLGSCCILKLSRLSPKLLSTLLPSSFSLPAIQITRVSPVDPGYSQSVQSAARTERLLLQLLHPLLADPLKARDLGPGRAVARLQLYHLLVVYFVEGQIRDESVLFTSQIDLGSISTIKTHPAARPPACPAAPRPAPAASAPVITCIMYT